ncbi:hypothetical protein D1B31_10000 [Neobacillus notoginsengisoli]|uniref:Uncharacterized protein n=1 Tax=Neobacillus notoginsengisoli TaxID=1578198 RepID=A0A417YVC8_9BACI|nr:hypothetical protein [Neobacillus notoginsengisoli]RHW41254.1 hypothetical protein D1B31_10000 [Neobacillus notoginsengisoli]
MPYIIENAAMLKEGRLDFCSILTDGKEVTAIRADLANYSLIRMNVEPFIMTPTHTILDSTFRDKKSREVAGIIEDRYLKKGCTTVLTYVEVEYEKALHGRLQEIEEAFSQSSADYAIGIKVPVRSLTPSLLVGCKKMKLPAVFVDVDSLESMDSVPWGWIRGAIFPYNCPLIPVFSGVEDVLKKQSLGKWEKLMHHWKIPSVNHELIEGTPLSASVLNKIGIYPWRSSLQHRSELSYNLYKRVFSKNNDKELLICQTDEPVITVHKGKVIRSGKRIDFKKGSGEYIKVKTHAFYSFNH